MASRPTKTAQILALADTGMSNADIARKLGIRYQHVRNTLIRKKRPLNYKRDEPASERKLFVELSDRGTITLPRQVRVPGTSLYEVRPQENGTIELVPQHPIPATQSWFWSDRWQRMEREAQRDIDEGRIKSFEDAETLIDELDRA